MEKLFLICTLVVLGLSGCAQIRIIPEQVENGIVDTVDNSQFIKNNGIGIKTRISEIDINAYNLDGTVTAFNVSINNSSSDEVSFAVDSFVLVDERGLQYIQLTPEKVRELITKDSYYLMPYPYVGFYYLEDFQKTSFYNRNSSSLPYYYELYPQDIFTKSLPLTAIIPGMMVEGLIYFKIDMAAHKQVKLYVYRKDMSKSSPPEFVFPFKITK